MARREIPPAAGCFVMSAADRDYYMAAAANDEVPDRYTRPSGETTSGLWSARQGIAAARLGKAWREALPLRGGPAGYSGGNRGGVSLNAQQEDDAQTAWIEYSQAIAQVEMRCGVRHADALRSVVIHDEGGHLWRVRDALDCLVDWWGIK